MAIAVPLLALLVSTVSSYTFQRADREMDAWVAHTADVIIAIQKAEISGSAVSGLAKLLQDEPAQQLRLTRAGRLHTLRAELATMRGEQENLLAVRLSGVKRLRAQNLAATALTALLGLGGGLLAILLFTSGVARGVERLQQNAARLELKLPMLPRASGKDELGSLERAFENASISLRRSEEERYRFFTLSLDMLCVAELDGRFLRVNPAFTTTLGYAEAELLAHGVLDYVHPHDRAATAAKLEELARGNPIAYLEARFRCADGSYKWLAWSCAPVLAEGCAYGVAHDRTGQKLDEQALRQSNARLTCVLESITDGFFAVDCGWRLTEVNPEAERIWQRKREDLLGRNLWEVFPEAVDGPFGRLYHEVMSTGKPGHLEDLYPFQPYNKWFDVHAYPSVDGLSVYFRDITERRQSQEKIARALQEKEVLLREVHHRVKNNLQVICSMLRLQQGYIHDEGLLQVLKECRERVVAMAMLHDQLHRAKDFSRINLGEYIRNLAASLFCSYGVDSAKIGLRMNVEDITVAADPVIPCGLIVTEVLSNALRHAFPGERRGHVFLDLHALPDDRIELTVCDDGKGFAEGAYADSPPSLGLRLVDLLAEQMEAAVERSSNAGTQYRFVFQAKRLNGE